MKAPAHNLFLTLCWIKLFDFLLVAPVCEVGQGPDSVHQDVDVRVVDQHRQRRKDFLKKKIKIT